MNEKRAPVRRTTLERIYRATIDEVWELWTTKAGIESWWGPDGFSVVVREIDVRAGGVLEYTMTATEAPQIEFMKRAGMPQTTVCKLSYTAVHAKHRLEYVNLADFIPGVEPYNVATTVELHEIALGVRMVLTFDAMHDETWTERQTMGWTNEVEKLNRVIEGRREKEAG